jgi:hypothetical protein
MISKKLIACNANCRIDNLSEEEEQEIREFLNDSPEDSSEQPKKLSLGTCLKLLIYAVGNGLAGGLSFLIHALLAQKTLENIIPELREYSPELASTLEELSSSLPWFSVIPFATSTLGSLGADIGIKCVAGLKGIAKWVAKLAPLGISSLGFIFNMGGRLFITYGPYQEALDDCRDTIANCKKEGFLETPTASTSLLCTDKHFDYTASLPMLLSLPPSFLVFWIKFIFECYENRKAKKQKESVAPEPISTTHIMVASKSNDNLEAALQGNGEDNELL